MCVSVFRFLCLPHPRRDAPQHTNQLDHWKLPVILLQNRETKTNITFLSDDRLLLTGVEEQIIQTKIRLNGRKESNKKMWFVALKSQWEHRRPRLTVSVFNRIDHGFNETQWKLSREAQLQTRIIFQE